MDSSKKSLSKKVVLFLLPIVLPIICAVLWMVGLENYRSTNFVAPSWLTPLVVLGPGWVSLWFLPVRMAFRFIAAIIYLPAMLPLMVYFILTFACWAFNSCI